MALPFDLSTQLAQRKSAALYRHRLCIDSPQAPEVIVDGKLCLAFCSNDYLGLANDARVKAAFKQAVDDYGVGSGASHLVIGHSRHHHALEEELAEFTGRDRALLFSNGYMANLGVINSLVGNGDTVIEDKFNHASLLDGGLNSGAKFLRYLHNDLDSLQTKLRKLDAGRCLIVTDGVFSMDGDTAPLTQISTIAAQESAWTMVDDAHGFGCLGLNGGGVLEQHKLSQQQVPILMATLGKAFGSAGAFIAGSEELIETLIQTARTYIYTTGLPPASAAASRQSLKIIQGEPERRQVLNELIQQFREGAGDLGLQLMASNSAIQPIIVGSSEGALKLSEQLRSEGIIVTAIRSPTVPVGTERLRVTLSAVHTSAQVDRLLLAFEKYCK